jgi:RNA ligase partner protein
MEQFILDTSLFTNPNVYSQFDTDPQKALTSFVELALASQAQFFMPYSVYEELLTMRDLAENVGIFQAAVHLRSPRRYNLMIPSGILYELIDEVRLRIDKGLRIAEEWTKRAGGLGEEPTETLITKLRERFRATMRQGIIDSTEDMDGLLLAYELDGVLVSADEGLKTWANKAGIKLLDCRHFKATLEILRQV